MAVLSGVQTLISGIPTVSRWMLEYNIDPARAVAAASSGGIINACGIEDWNVDIFAIGTTPAYKPGDALTFTGVTTTGKGVTGSAVVGRVSLYAEYAQNRFFGIRYELAANGALTFGTVSGSDSAEPTIVCPAGMSVSINSSSVNNIAACIVSLEKEMIPYSATGTSGVQKKLVGAFTATVAIDMVMNDDFTVDPDTEYNISVQVGESSYWTVNGTRLIRVMDYGFDLMGQLPRRQPPVARYLFAHSAEDSESTVSVPGLGTIWPES
mgnify:CR=1 FL=1